VSNKYFDFWHIQHPVFLSGSKNLFSVGPSHKLKERLITQLSVGMHLQIFEGDPGTGKTSILKNIASDLSPNAWDVLYLSASDELLYSTYIKKLMSFLNTSEPQQVFPSLQKIVSNLERLSKSRRKILILLDIDSTAKNIDSFSREARALFEIVQSHDLTLYSIISIPKEFNAMMMPLIEKSAWHGALPPFKRKEMQQIIQLYLENANLSPNLFDEPVLEYIFKNANGSFTKALQLSESLLIDASIADSMIIKYPTMESPVKEHDLAYSSNPTHLQEVLSQPSQPLELASNPQASVKFELDTAVEDNTEKQLPQKLSPINDISQSTPNQTTMNAQLDGANASSEKVASLSIDKEFPISLSKPKDNSKSSISSPNLVLDIDSDLVNDALMPESSLNQNSIKTIDLTIDSLGESQGEPNKDKSSLEPGVSPNQPNSASANKEDKPSAHENEPLVNTKASDEKETPKKGKKSRVKPKSQEPKQRQSLSSLTKPL
jgi:hypothetical protein